MKRDERFILAQANRYLLEEPCESLQSEVKNLLASSLPDRWLDLHDRMKRDLNFGTAGVRGKMEAGYHRMNLVSVYRLTYALGIELLSDTSVHRSVVVGCDARHRSSEFADEVSQVLRSMGLIVHRFQEPIPTPLCAYATQALSAAMGVMITASHNPSWDNGIKLFCGTSAQAQGKFLRYVEDRRKEVPLRPDFHNEFIKSLGEKNLVLINEEIEKRYFRDIKATRFTSNVSPLDRDIKVAYTPLHGVGKKFFLRALHEENFFDVVVVAEQAEPNGDFKTVAFPNPEEAHTLDLAHALGERQHCDLVIANDPDADRLQVSCPDDESGVMKKLSGNEIGIIFGYFSLLRARDADIKPLLASSIVSSRMLKAMCAQMGAHYVDALTGFCNIVQTALTKQSQLQSNLIFAYEEAIGFLLGRVVLDKDGVHAAVRFMEIASLLKSEGKTIWQLLDELYLRFGLFVNTSWSWRFDGPDAMENMQKTMSNVRAIHPQAVASLLNQSECDKHDLLDLQQGVFYDGLQSDVVIFEMKYRGRIIVRPSGTEPKIKFYLELWDHATDRQMLSNKRLMLNEVMVPLKSELQRLFGHKGT